MASELRGTKVAVLALLPGGTMNPDQLGTNPDAVEFVRAFVETGKPVASICRGP